MKFSILILLATLSLTTYAAQSADTSTEQQAKAELNALNQVWFDARVSHDWDTLEQILDDNFLATFATGKTVDRSAFMDAVKGVGIPQFEVMHDVIEIHGDTALIINFSENRDLKVTWVAVKKAGKWRIISMTFTVFSNF